MWHTTFPALNVSKSLPFRPPPPTHPRLSSGSYFNTQFQSIRSNADSLLSGRNPGRILPFIVNIHCSVLNLVQQCAYFSIQAWPKFRADNTRYSPSSPPETDNRLLNEFLLYSLQEKFFGILLHTGHPAVGIPEQNTYCSTAVGILLHTGHPAVTVSWIQ